MEVDGYCPGNRCNIDIVSACCIVELGNEAIRQYSSGGAMKGMIARCFERVPSDTVCELQTSSSAFIIIIDVILSG